MPRPNGTGFRLANLLDRRTFRHRAGSGSFARGEDYFSADRVRSLDEFRGTVVAKVHGSVPYSVKLWAEGKDLACSCTCPRGADGEFCKHCVAVGLAVLAGRTRARRSRQPKITLDDVRGYLVEQDKTTLVDLLMERAVEDDALREQLLLRAARTRKGAAGVAAVKEALDRALDPGRFLDWREVASYASGVEKAVKTVEEVLEEGGAAEVIGIAEHALDSAEKAIGQVDDSDGQIRAVLDRLQELHHRACKEARPDPVELARRLFEREMESGYDVFSGAVITYADVLGRGGVAEYRRLAENCWKKVPALGPGEDDPEKYGSRFRISSIMMALARMDGDVEAQVEVLKRDLSNAYRYLSVAKTCREAGEADLALEWAEKGLNAFPERTDSRLRELAAEEYHRRKRHDDAMALAWAAFSDQPNFAEYQNLKRHAERSRSWPAWREKAIAAIRQEVARRKSKLGKSIWAHGADHSTLVGIFLWEGDLESAWNEAQTGGCDETLWTTLAKKRGREYPQDVLPIYQRHVELALRQGHHHAYAMAVELLEKIAGVMSRIGDGNGFAGYLESVRVTHARKRNFMSLLARAKWTRAPAAAS